jgi:hypothetical protein
MHSADMLEAFLSDWTISNTIGAVKDPTRDHSSKTEGAVNSGLSPLTPHRLLHNGQTTLFLTAPLNTGHSHSL